jgi:hypothetical protein
MRVCRVIAGLMPLCEPVSGWRRAYTCRHLTVRKSCVSSIHVLP